MLYILAFLPAFWILFLLPVGILTLVQKRFPIKYPVGHILMSFITATIFALIGFYGANTLLDAHGFPDTPTLIFIYSIVGLGILFGAGMGVPLFLTIRQFTSSDTGASRSALAIVILLLSFVVAIGLCAILWFFWMWAAG